MTRLLGNLHRNALLDLLVVSLAAAGNFLLVARSSLTLTALTLLTAAFLLRIVQIRRAILHVPFQAPLWLFGLTAVFSVTASYDPAASWQKVWWIVGGIILFYVVATIKTAWVRLLVVAGLLAFTTGTAIYFLTQTDFAAEPAKLAVVNQIGNALHRLAPQLGWHTPHPNLIAGILLLGLPFGLAWSLDAARKRAWLIAAPVALVTLLHGFALFMTTSRGAWLALAGVAFLGAWFGGAEYVARRARLSRNVGFVAALNLLLLALLLVLLIGGSGLVQSAFDAVGAVGGMSRLELYRDAAQLAQAVPFTGIGVNTFGLNFSTYALMIDVLFLPHAHNVYLEVWIEQGVLGLVALVWLIGAYFFWAWRYRPVLNWLAWASVGAVAMMLLHNVVDVTFYFSRILPVMFLPFALPITAVRDARKNIAPISRRTQLTALGIAAVLGIALGAVAIIQNEKLGAWWNANQGAVAQAKIELAQYEFPQRTVHVLRRTLDLDLPIMLYAQALAHDAHNVTANTRLGAIYLDRGDYVQAVEYLETAYRAAPHNRATIKALGYAYTWTGQTDQAIALLKNIPEAATELKTYAGALRKQQPQLADYADVVIHHLNQKAQE
jgi:O-antigen ligase